MTEPATFHFTCKSHAKQRWLGMHEKILKNPLIPSNRWGCTFYKIKQDLDLLDRKKKQQQLNR